MSERIYRNQSEAVAAAVAGTARGLATPDPNTRQARATAARNRIEKLAREVAADAPARQGSYTHRAGIRWTLVHDLRDAIATLDAIVAEGDE